MAQAAAGQIHTSVGCPVMKSCMLHRGLHGLSVPCQLSPAKQLLSSATWRCHSAARDAEVTIIGAGAAGLTAAFFAAEAGAKVAVLERTREAGKKILMSGGTRCNVLPLEVDLQQDFFSDSPSSAVRAVFASWPLAACRAWLEDPDSGVGLELVEEEETAKLFPASNSSREVRDKLLAACIQRGVRIQYGASLEGLYPARQPDGSAVNGSTPANQDAPDRTHAAQEGLHVNGSAAAPPPPPPPPAVALKPARSSRRRGPKDGAAAAPPARQLPAAPSPGWICRLQDGSIHTTDRVVVCTGGLSFPAVGTDGTGHRLLADLGLPLISPYPALTPLTGTHPGKAQLAGLSLYNVDLAVGLPGAKKPRKSARTGLLFTHKGYSGPAVLDLSHHAVKAITHGRTRPTLLANWTADPPEVWQERLQAGGTALVSTILQRSGLRERLANAICEELGLAQRRMCELRKEERAALIQRLTAYELQYNGHEGYKKAEVTGGGVPLNQIDTRNLECRAMPGLHLAGEILDVFGRIGGFNFYWAWVSGRLAGQGAAAACLRDKQLQQQMVSSAC